MRHRLICEAAGLDPVPVAVDEHGIDVAALAETGCEVVVVTPAHQFPTGAVLSAERRAALLEWAEDQDALIVEDDYDSELRYDRVAVGALQGLAPERVCQIGSVSKRLAPGVGLGWMLAPSWLSGALTYEQGSAAGCAQACSSSSRWPISWRGASWTATCAGCACATGAGARPCWPGARALAARRPAHRRGGRAVRDGAPAGGLTTSRR